MEAKLEAVGKERDDLLAECASLRARNEQLTAQLKEKVDQIREMKEVLESKARSTQSFSPPVLTDPMPSVAKVSATDGILEVHCQRYNTITH